MKTVMKKLMSLLLVAVLLVSAVPFQASADEVSVTLKMREESGGEIYGNTTVTLDDAAWTSAEVQAAAEQKWGTTHTYSHCSSSIKEEDGVKVIYVVMTPKTCLTCGKRVNECDCCEVCGKTAANCDCCDGCGVISGSNHTSECTLYYACCQVAKTGDHATTCANYCDQSPSCGAPAGAHKTSCLSLCDPTNPNCGASNHKEGCVSLLCNNDGCTQAKGHTTKHDWQCTKTAGCTYKANHAQAVCSDQACTVCKGDHTTANCPYCATCYTSSNGKIMDQTHKANAHCTYCNLVGTHSAGCFTQAETYTLNVYARRRIDNYVRDTVLLKSYTLEKNTSVLDWIYEHRDELHTAIDTKLGADHDWSHHVYNYEGTELTATTTLAVVNGEKNVYLNAYGKESEVLLYIHLNGSATNDRIAALHGFDARVKEDQTISKSAVLARVQEYYGTGISMKMYSESGWADKLNGKSGTDAGSAISLNPNGVTKIHVSISGGTTTKYTADSTNPKTGDEIFMAITTLAVSASALALCFYFNKKRAVK